MPRYFFSTVNGDVHLDHEGTELSGLAEARLVSVNMLGTILKDHPDRFWEGDDLILTVSNDDDLELFRIAVVAINGPLAELR